jgi:hypothetical protein
MKVVGIFFASPTSISPETLNIADNLEVKLEEKQPAKVLKVEILAKCGTGAP